MCPVQFPLQEIVHVSKLSVAQKKKQFRNIVVLRQYSHLLILKILLRYQSDQKYQDTRATQKKIQANFEGSSQQN